MTEETFKIICVPAGIPSKKASRKSGGSIFTISSVSEKSPNMGGLIR